MSLLILFFVISITVSLLCSLWESVLLSITPSFVQQQLSKGAGFGRQLADFKTSIDRPLAAILTLNTIAHTVGAIGVGHQASVIWAETNLIITSVVVPVSMTLAILILSEIIPKTVGAMHWKRLARPTVTSLVVIIRLLWPLVWLCQQITRALSRSDKPSNFSRNDLLAMTQIGTKEGKLDIVEATFIQHIMKLNHFRIKDIMTPWPVVLAAKEDLPIEVFYDDHQEIPFSRIPIYSGNSLDNITGFILKTDVLHQLYLKTGHKPLTSLKREVTFLPESTTVLNLFKHLIKKRDHIAMVINEHGMVVGLVTLEDVIESILGQEIVDETDVVVDMQTLVKNK